jgi:hypothetical protein
MRGHPLVSAVTMADARQDKEQPFLQPVQWNPRSDNAACPSGGIVGVVDETFRLAHVSLWPRPIGADS